MASVRNLLAKWLGGAGAIPQAGIRSLLARWLGGAGAEPQGGLTGGGSSDVARTRSYEASGGAVFDGSALVAQISGRPASVGGGGSPARKFKPDKARKRRAAQTYSHGSSGGLELAFSGATSRKREILASGGLALRAEYTASRVRVTCSAADFILIGSAEFETYDAIYETEDEELMLFAA